MASMQKSITVTSVLQLTANVHENAYQGVTDKAKRYSTKSAISQAAYFLCA